MLFHLPQPTLLIMPRKFQITISMIKNKNIYLMQSYCSSEIIDLANDGRMQIKHIAIDIKQRIGSL